MDLLWLCSSISTRLVAIRVSIRVRVRIRIRVKIRVKIRVRVRVGVRVRVRVRVRIGLLRQYPLRSWRPWPLYSSIFDQCTPVVLGFDITVTLTLTLN